MEASEQIRLIRKNAQLTQAEFAKSLGVSTSTIASIENGTRDIPKNLMKKLVKEKRISAEWLLTGEGNISTELVPAVKQSSIPLLRQTVSCGPGQDWQDADNIESYIEPLSLAAHGKELYAFRSRGISMVGTGIQDGLQDDIYVFGYNGEAFCKFLRFDIFSGKIHIYSVHNKDLDKAELLRTLDSGTEGFQIFGRVLCWIHENRLMWR